MRGAGEKGYIPLHEMSERGPAEETWSHDTEGVGTHKSRSDRLYEGRTGLTLLSLLRCLRLKVSGGKKKKCNAQVDLEATLGKSLQRLKSWGREKVESIKAEERRLGWIQLVQVTS